MKRSVVVAVLLFAAACGGGDDEGAAATTTTAADETTTTAEVTSTTTVTTSASGDRCEGPVRDAPDAGAGAVALQLDAEGADDSAFTVQDDDGAWHLHVALDGDRGGVDEQLPTVPTDSAAVDTAADLDGDGDDELLVVVGNGAAAQIYGVYDLDGCDLEAAQLDGRAAELPVGGSVVELHGLRCPDAGGLIVLTATSDDGVNYTTSARSLSYAAGTLTESSVTPGTLTTDSPDFPTYTQLDC